MDTIKENPKDPLWVVKLKVAHSVELSMVVGPDGKPAARVLSTHPESTTTCHAPDEEVAKAYVRQQNPGALILSATKAA
jgi:hypothetical protein